MIRRISTHIADVDSLARLTTAAGVVRERVRRVGRPIAGIEAARGAMDEARGTTEASATAEATEATASAEASTAGKAAAEATTTAETAAATEPTSTGEPVLAHLEVAALPLIAVELLNGIASVVGRLEGDDAGTLGPAVGSNMHIGADDLAVDG